MNNFINDIERIYKENICYEEAQSICRKILSEKISDYKFQDISTKSIAENFVNTISFPLEYKTETEKCISINKSYQNRSYILGGIGICGIITSLLAKEQNAITATINIISIMSGCASGFYYAKSSATEFHKKTRIVTPKETLIKYIDTSYRNLIMIDKFTGNSQIHLELLSWIQSLYAWACRDANRNKIKEDIDSIMQRFGYEFFHFSPNDADFFDASNANIDVVTTTVPALFSINNHENILRGSVIFPLN